MGLKLTKQLPIKLSAVVVRYYSIYRRWLYLRNQATAKPFRFQIPYNMTVQFYPYGQISEPLFDSKFEQTEINLVTAYLRPGMNVLDIGANIGLYSIIASKIVGERGKVWAFEPSSETYERLMANLALNGISSVEVVKIALADVISDWLVLRRDPGYRDGDRYLSTRRKTNAAVAGKADDLGDTEVVEVTSLDYYFTSREEGLPRIDFAKIDIEGGELSALRGGRQLLTNSPDVVLMLECTPEGCFLAGHTQEEVFQFLRRLGFGVHCWNQALREWISDMARVKSAGNIWACRDRRLLPNP